MSGGKCPRGKCPGGFCPVTIWVAMIYLYIFIILYTLK